MIAVNHHRACNGAQPLTPGIDLLPRLRDRGCRTITAQACAAADRRRASRSDSSRWRKNQRAEEEETATLIPRFSRSSGEHPPMSISSAIKSASSRWLSWRSECRCGAWHPEIISPCGASPVAPEVGRFQTPPVPPCCARRVKAACQAIRMLPARSPAVPPVV